MTHIYALLDPDTNEVRYVGKTVKPKQRYHEHCTDKKNNHKACWIRSLDKKPVMIILDKAEEDWAEWEQWWISYFKFLGAQLVNATKGGEGTPGYKLPESAKRKIGEAGRKRIVSLETRQKLSLAGMNRKHTEESKAKISAVHKGKTVSAETMEKLKNRIVSEENKRLQSERMKNLSPETRAKMSESAKRRGISEEAKRKMALTRQGRKHSEESKKKMSESRKKYWAGRKGE